MTFDWTRYYPPSEYPTNPAQCPTPGCAVVAVDPTEDAQMDKRQPLAVQYDSTLSSIGVADCPEHGRWYWMPSPEHIDLERSKAILEALLGEEN